MSHEYGGGYKDSKKIPYRTYVSYCSRLSIIIIIIGIKKERSLSNVFFSYVYFLIVELHGR